MIQWKPHGSTLHDGSLGGVVSAWSLSPKGPTARSVLGSKKATNPTKYQTFDGSDFKRIEAPTFTSEIEKTKKQNNLVLNVSGFDKRVIVFRISEQHEAMSRINLLLFEKAGFTPHG